MLAYVKESADATPGFKDVPVPVVGPRDVLIRVKATAICGTDLLVYQGKLDETVYPLTLGHEFSGEVAEIGTEVKTVRVGDAVIANAVKYCQECDSCKTGDSNLCRHFTHLGIHCDGCFAEFVAMPEYCVLPMPGGMDFDVAAEAGPVALVYHAMNKATIRPGSVIVVSGPGAIGVTAVHLARIWGATVINTGTSADGWRLDVAKEAGAITVNVDSENVQKVVDDLTNGRGADLFVESSGAPLIQQGIELVKRGGEVLLIGYSPRPQLVQALDIVFKELTVLGSSGYNHDTFTAGLRIIAEHPEVARSTVSHRLKFDELDEGFRMMTDRSAMKIILEL
jgi:L-iditol 2-dehydrogenase